MNFEASQIPHWTHKDVTFAKIPKILFFQARNCKVVTILVNNWYQYIFKLNPKKESMTPFFGFLVWKLVWELWKWHLWHLKHDELLPFKPIFHAKEFELNRDGCIHWIMFSEIKPLLNIVSSYNPNFFNMNQYKDPSTR